MKITDPFESERIRFRLLEEGDLEAVYRQFSDLDMCKFFSDPPCDSEEALEIIEHYKNPEGKGYLRYGMFDKISGEFIGTCGYHYLDEELSQVEIGYDVWKDFWGQGFMTEAMPFLLNVCFDDLAVNCVYILTHPDNAVSQAVAKKFGFQECEPCRPTPQYQMCMKLMRS